MNKLMGFYELRELNIPTVPWERYSQDTKLDGNMLWTIRVAVKSDDDLNLPRAVGVTSKEAAEKGNILLDKYENSGMVIYYPYFIADKSGVIDIRTDRTVIEAVEKDLWNLVTHGRKDVSIVLENDNIKYFGNTDFLSEEELNSLLYYANRIKGNFRSTMSEGKSIIAEWSFAYNTDIEHKPLGDKYLVFYELRSI
ncbi:MAG TPA: hypothetical protein VEG39_04110 [Clostridia bacterium]|nr:hypothetical protein [Clostridia bacterium]